jgi:RING finger protein 113A
MFKKRTQKGNVRKKREVDNDQAAEGSAAKRQAVASDGAADGGNGDPGDGSGPVVSEVVRDVGRGDKSKQVNAFSTGRGGDARTAGGVMDELYDKSSGAAYHETRGGATATNEIDTAPDRDARAIAERNMALNAEGATNDESKIYRGQAGYKNYIEKDAAAIGNNKNTGTQGPIRAPAFFRATCRFDYQPDICKDYKDTGFCGFGDSCKFMHDRGNYKTGWQMEKEWEDQATRRKELIAMGIDPDSEDAKKTEQNIYAVGGGGSGGGGDGDAGGGGVDVGLRSADDLPFACFLCRGPFSDPVMTKCGHHFCRACVVTSFKSVGPNCPVCDKNTSGIFNVSRKLAAHGARHGGFKKLFKTMSKRQAGGGEGGDSDEDDGDEDGNNDEEEARGGAAAGGTAGSWAIMDDEEEKNGGGGGGGGGEGGESGVAELLEQEAEERRRKEEATAAAKAKAEAEAEAAKVKAEKAAAAVTTAAAALGWQQVTSGGKSYWHHAGKNQTAWDTPLEVKNRIRADEQGGGGGGEGAAAAAATQWQWQRQWQAATDSQGRTYYYNPTTRETSWVPPAPAR